MVKYSVCFWKLIKAVEIGGCRDGQLEGQILRLRNDSGIHNDGWNTVSETSTESDCNEPGRSVGGLHTDKISHT